MAVTAAAYWRWLRSGQMSPCYPTMRLCRQSRWAEWRDVFEQIALQMRRVLNRSRHRVRMSHLEGQLAGLQAERRQPWDRDSKGLIHARLGAFRAAQARFLMAGPLRCPVR